MNLISRNTLMLYCLLLGACANQEQSQVAKPAKVQPVVVAGKQDEPSISESGPHAIAPQPLVKAQGRAAEPPLQEAGAAVAPEASAAKRPSRAPVASHDSRRARIGERDMAYPAPVSPASPATYTRQVMPDREQYGQITDNPVKRVTESPVSTFSIDVDTGAYANVRRMLNEGRLPPADAVRLEEMINYFPYAYAQPPNNAPFAVHTEIAPAPWNPNRHLLRIGIKGQDKARTSLPPSNLVFLVDVSGSMTSSERLPLLKSALKLLTNQLRPQDRVSLVTYASGTRVVLEPTSGAHKARIEAALNSLRAGGSTHGAAGIELAYRMAEHGYIRGGINRILLATDGDFNVGVTSFEALKNMVEEKRRGGVSLSTLGFGVGNYNERLMEQLADAGNGNYSYIDTLNEGQKVLVDEMSSTLATIAKDVKIQIEFNPAVVSEYRLLGYENRMLKREDFNNDRVDAGEVGAGHTVTAIYELTLSGNRESVDPLRYGSETRPVPEKSVELAFLRMRYKEPDGDVSRLTEWPLHCHYIKASFAQASEEFRFATAVAAFAQRLRGGKYTGGMDYADIAQIAARARGADAYGYRGEFVRLVHMARALSTRLPAAGVGYQE